MKQKFERNMKIFLLREDRYTLREIGEKYGISPPRVLEIERNMKEKLTQKPIKLNKDKPG